MVFEIYDQTPAVDTCLSSDQQQKIKKVYSAQKYGIIEKKTVKYILTTVQQTSLLYICGSYCLERRFDVNEQDSAVSVSSQRSSQDDSAQTRGGGGKIK